MPAETIPLTARQRDLLNIICELIDTTGIAPSVTEMAREMDTASRGNVARLLDALQERGWITRQRHRARTIQVLHRPTLPAFDERFVLSPALGGAPLEQLPPRDAWQAGYAQALADMAAGADGAHAHTDGGAA